MARHTLTIDIDPPEGWEYAGDVRNAEDGDTWLHSDGRALLGPMALPVPILRRKRWRAKHGETFYSVSGGGNVFPMTEQGRWQDHLRYRIGNYWQTEQQAKEYRDGCVMLSNGMYEKNTSAQQEG
jgi:hypothetical protein